MFNQEDIDAMVRMTGLSEVEIMANETIGAEYIMRQRMYHASGQQGALPPLALIDMLRFLKFEPPARKAPLKALEVDWRAQRRNTRVVVTPEDDKPEKQFYGNFLYVPEAGRVAVILDGAVNGWVEEYAYRQVALAPENTPAFVPPVDKSAPSLNPLPAPPPVASEAAEQFPKPELRLADRNADRDDPTRGGPAPVLSKDWSSVLPGHRVVVQAGDDLVDAEFIEEGPTDGHVSVLIDERVEIVPEEAVAY